MSGPMKVVVALGGNALEDKSLPPTAASQREVAGRTSWPSSTGTAPR